MPTYRVTGPDGHTYEVTAPEGATEQQVLSMVQQQVQATQAPQQPEGSALGNAASGAWQGVKDTAMGVGQIAAHGGPMAGLLSVAEKLGMPQIPSARIMDDIVQADQAEFAASTAGQSGWGTAGRITGNIVSSAPAGAIAAPAKALGWGQNALRAALGGAAGAVAQPVLDGDFASGKLTQAAVGAGAGGVLGTAGKALQSGAERLLPSNVTAQVLNPFIRRANETPVAKEGEALVQRTGVQLSPGAVSGSKAQTMAENAARQSVFSRDLAFQADQRTAQQVSDYIGRVMDGVKTTGDSPAVVGERVRGTVRNAVNKLQSQRDQAASKDYGAVRELTNGRLALKLDGYEGKLKEIIEEFGSAPKGSDQGRIAGALNDLLNQSNVARRPEKLMQTRRFLSQIAGGQASIAGETGRNIQKGVARDLLQAIDADLDANADALGGNVGAMLKQANARYRGFSQSIEKIEATPLGKLLGEEFAQDGVRAFNSVAPEKIVQRMAKLEPSEVGVVRDILERESPETWQSLKRRFLEDAMEAGQQQAPSDGVNGLAIKGGAFVNALARTPKDAARLKAYYSPKELAEINDAFSVIQRWNDKTGYNFSGTAAQSELLGIMNTFKEIAMRGSVSAAGQVMGVRSIARVMNDQAGRRALLELKRAPRSVERSRQLAAALAGAAFGKHVGQPPEGPEGGDQ